MWILLQQKLKEQMIKRNIFLMSIVFFISTVSLLFLSCREREVTNDELVEITSFISSFYKLNQNMNYKDFEALYINNSIDFYIQDDSPVGVTRYLKNENDYFQLNDVIAKWGKRRVYKIKKILFSPQPYDVPESNLYFIDLDVDYEGKETYESFFLKKVNSEYYVYRYWIVYRSDRNTRKQ